ncbi:3-hydroxyacyl-CoA dehydrogenase NAD-binding domain-containing protein [Roseomonas sp. GC11]|uniref:3-hydroxyacyl-CoA dehydrogenase NAD-binding domain-containing protein n=1 Tax=Roseomonas sp. GC11 TaxID=2950546 RepID=UPI0021098F50|nr:3-hydroxyacyl-CoA dehydrogenase NAD-binding domain-containing protein [Roseomonas sp. GC11]MCQ4160031.1 3-hydroxyacyl-CoA dehydrogenase NAD-binding domain-containing protein [Roseomonas sp. GC11]
MTASPTPLAGPVAVIGTGLIGAAWATLFLARGLDVVAYDPAPDAETQLRATLATQWPAMQSLGLAPGASVERLRFAASPEDAVAHATFVQESGPEDGPLKRALFQRLDAAAPPAAILASSSSTLGPSHYQDACARHPERVLLGHPFNPAHLIPLVEVLGGPATAPGAITRAMDFYRALGKHPILLHKEINGHVANRLQAALWQEAFHLAAEGVASIADIDAAIAQGPGLRWALLGPFLNLHFAGGPGGIAALFEKPLWRATEGMWADLGRAHVDTRLAQVAREGVAEALAGREAEAVREARDEALLALLRLKAAQESLA